MLKNLVGFIFCLFVFSVAANSQTKPAETENKQTAPPVKKANARPNNDAAKDALPEPFAKSDAKTMAVQCVKFETDAGVIEMELFPETAPESVRNFLNLAAIGAFDTTAFSRVVPGFVIQGGDLYSGEKMNAELDKRARRTIPDEPGQIKHERGILSMARSDEPNSATTSFFILVGAAPHLDDKFAAFGRVTKGMETVDAINKAPVENEKPKNPVRIKKATVAPCASNNF
jgi:peptidyl-prolyl cis-trans isomerase B (cyclophilin B)